MPRYRLSNYPKWIIVHDFSMLELPAVIISCFVHDIVKIHTMLTALHTNSEYRMILKLE